MLIRPYQPEDDPHLIALERQSPRGFPKPFVHFRKRFIQRAEMYRHRLTLVAVDSNRIIGVSSIIVKDTLIEGDPAKIAYSFDTRVHPDYRRMGVGHAMVEEKLRWAKAEGAIGVYSFIVTTNQASLGMVSKSGYEKCRLVLYLDYRPQPLFEPHYLTAQCSNEPFDHDLIDVTYSDRNLFVPDVAERVKDYDFQRWYIDDADYGYAALSVYNQAHVYSQISTEAPWPTTAEQIERLGRNLQIFDVIGTENNGLMEILFDWLRDDAVSNNVNKLTWITDRLEHVPPALLDQAHQKDYWLMFSSFYSDWTPDWTNLVYLDPRDV